MNPARGDANNGLAGTDLAAVNDLIFLDDADAEPGEIKIAAQIKPGHLGRLAANQGAPGVLTAFGHSPEHFFHHLWVDLADREVVEKKKRLGAERKDVVHVHRDKVNAYSLKTPR